MKIVSGTIIALLISACTTYAQEATSWESYANSASLPAFPFSADAAFLQPLTLVADSVSLRPATSKSFLVPQPPVPDLRQRSGESSQLSGSLQLAVGYEYVRFRSALFDANLSGLHTSFTYYRNDWLGFEGNVVAAFGSSNLLNEPSHLVLYGAGPRIAWDRRTWQPWAHALAGGIHVYPQTASSINGFALQLGGGVDWPWKPLVSFRLQSDYVRSQLYSSGQNSFQLGASLVFHF